MNKWLFGEALAERANCFGHSITGMYCFSFEYPVPGSILCVPHKNLEQVRHDVLPIQTLKQRLVDKRLVTLFVLAIKGSGYKRMRKDFLGLLLGRHTSTVWYSKAHGRVPGRSYYDRVGNN